MIYCHKYQIKYFYPLSPLAIIPSPTMTSLEKCPRLSFQQAMELTRLPNRESGTGSVMLRFMNRQPPWATGDAIPWEASGIPRPPGTKVAFGGVVYAQAPLAAARAIESRADSNPDKDRAFGIHVRAPDTFPKVSMLTRLATVHSCCLHKPWTCRPPLRL